MSGIGAIEDALRGRREAGGKALVAYVTGGLGDDWLETVRAVAAAGADVIEIGLPFSDPVMDGPIIQAANDRALAGGVVATCFACTVTVEGIDIVHSLPISS